MHNFSPQSSPAHSSRQLFMKTLAKHSSGFGCILAAGAVALSGCGSNYRPTVIPIIGTGPGSQQTAYAFVVSTPSAMAEGIGTLVDYSGDTIMATAPIGPGPQTFTLATGGSQAWTLNSDGTLSNVPVVTNLQQKNITYTTLNPYTGINPIVGLFSGAAGLYAMDVSANNIDVLTGSPDAFKLVVPVDPSPVMMVGTASVNRFYAVTQGVPYLSPISLNGTSVDGGVACTVNPTAVSVKGVADGIETGTYTVSSKIPLGICPVWAIGTADARRIFVLNRGDDTITVLNSQNNTLDLCSPGINQNGQPYSCHPSLPVTPSAGKANAGPVYGEYNPVTNQIVVANYDGDSISIIDVALDEYGNDGPNFGTTYTVPVGHHPASVTVLADGSRAYVANQSDSTVTVVNMASHTVEKTLPVTGHPRSVSSIQNSLYGKVYVVSPDSPYVSIIRTDQDILATTVLVQGNALDVRITSPDTSLQNPISMSRLPGAGQPCFLPPEAFTKANVPVTITNCKYQDPGLL